jgi:hypothetical protein
MKKGNSHLNGNLFSVGPVRRDKFEDSTYVYWRLSVNLRVAVACEIKSTPLESTFSVTVPSQCHTVSENQSYGPRKGVSVVAQVAHDLYELCDD